MIQLNNLIPWEQVIKVIKIHWIAYVILWFHIFITFSMNFIVLFTLWNTALSLLIISMLWTISLVILYIQWINYELDMFLITNNRIIWVEQVGFLNRTVSETSLAQIQEVNSITKWFFANIFNYWDIAIQTAWNKTSLMMTMAPDPVQEARIIKNISQKNITKWMEGVLEIFEKNNKK